MRITIKSILGRDLLCLLAPVLLFAGCGPAASGRSSSGTTPTVASSSASSASAPPAAAARKGAPLVECAAADFDGSLLTRRTAIPALEDWPLDGSDPAPGSSKENPVMRCGPRDSYSFVAGTYRCADGGNPLEGNVGAGGAARRGNVGPNSQHHIIDLYDVPCSGGAEQVYVDMYGCPKEAKRQASEAAMRINEDIPPAVDKLMREALELAGDEKYADAIAKLKQALALFDQAGDAAHPNRARLLDLLGSLQQEAELPDDAEGSLAAAYRVWNGVGWPPIALSGNTCVRLAKLYAARQQATLATCVAQRGIAYLEDVKGQYDSRIIGSLYLLGEIYLGQGELELAERMLRRGVRLSELSHGRRHPLVQRGLNHLEALFARRGDAQSQAAIRRRAVPRTTDSNKI